MTKPAFQNYNPYRAEYCISYGMDNFVSGWLGCKCEGQRQFITASTQLPVIYGAMAACCTRSGVWGKCHLTTAPIQRYLTLSNIAKLNNDYFDFIS